MNLKLMVEKLEDVPEAARPLYLKDEATGKFKLPVDGVVPKEKLDEFRDTNISVMRERDALMAKLQGVDLEEYATLKAAAQKQKDKKLLDEGKVEELVQERVGTMKTNYESQISDLTNKFTSTRSRLESVLIDSEISRAAMESGCEETALDDIINRGRQVFRLTEADKVVPKDGDRVLYGADGITPLSIKEWLQVLMTKAPHLFKQSKGGGAGGGNGSGYTGSVSKRSELKTAGEKAAYIGKHGMDAYLSLPA